MAVNIRDVLNRRGDLSTFVVHLTRECGDGPTPADNLRSIIRERRLRARHPMGWAATQDGDRSDIQSQRVVCFSEAPLEHVYSLVADIELRQIRLAPYGLAFTKLGARRLGVNPVLYVDMTPGRTWEMAAALDQMRDRVIKTGKFHEQPQAQVFPFMEPMGTWVRTGRKKEFWWEREWRHRGDLEFEPWQVALWLCPEAEHDAFLGAAAQLLREREEEWQRLGWEPPPHGPPALIDATWGVEQIVAHLIGHGGDVTPFSSH